VTIDVQYMTTLANIPTQAIYVTEGGFYDNANTLFNLQTPPLVVSVSWDCTESFVCPVTLDMTGSYVIPCTPDSTAQYISRTNQEFLKLAARGISVLFASGDSGAVGIPNSDCSQDNSPTSLNPFYPASSNWATSVGSTTLNTFKEPKEHPPICDYRCEYTNNQPVGCSNGKGKEILSFGVNSGCYFASGGGFSNFTPQPVWQQKAVQKYLDPNTNKTYPLPNGFFNSSNRAYPDVSALGSASLVILGGQLGAYCGTSISVQAFGAMVSLLNEHRLREGKNQLGFLNPLLYQMAEDDPSIFNDIIVGSNNYGESYIGSQGCLYGFGTAAGWDPASGLGSLNFKKALRYIKKLP